KLRDMLEDIPDRVGVRTRDLPTFVAQQLDPAQVGDDERIAIMEVVARIGAKDRAEEADTEADDEATGADAADVSVQSAAQTAQFMFFTRREAAAIAGAFTRALAERGAAGLRKLKRDEVLKLIGTLAEPHGVEIALFGRMTTSSPLKDVGAA